MCTVRFDVDSSCCRCHGRLFYTEIALKLYPIKAAAIHLEYELPLYIATLNPPKTMNKLDLAIAIAADIGMNKTFAYRALIAIEQQSDAEGFAEWAGGLKGWVAGLLVSLFLWSICWVLRGTGAWLQCN